MKKFRLLKLIFESITSVQGVNFIIFLITISVLTFLLASRYYLCQNIIENGISKKDIYAVESIKIPDIDKTEKRKYDVSRKVEPIMTPVQDDYIRKNLTKLIDSIAKVRDKKTSYAIKYEQLKEIFDDAGKFSASDKVFNYLLKTSDKNFEKVGYESEVILSILLEEGISEYDLSKKIDKKIQDKIEKNFSKIQQQTISYLIKNIIVPNMVIDEVATEIARKNAVNSVKPIMASFEKGEKIASYGKIVTRLQKDALKKAGYNVVELNITGIIGIFILVSLSLYSIVYYLVNFEPKYMTPPYLALTALLAFFTTLCASFLPSSVPVYIIPFAAVAILLTIFTNMRIALLTSILIVTMIAISLQYNIEVIMVFIIGVMAATFTTSKINYTRRMDLVRTGLGISLAQVLVVLATYLLQNTLNDVNLNLLFTDISLAFVSGLISGIIALGTLPLIESTFKIITPYGLAELSDHNQPLLKRLQFEAPGTYHHSLMVSNLVEAAAESVNANPILARVGAFYHDIGKLKRPLFFVENQSYFGIENPHEKLNPRLSKMVITAHPRDGVELAKEYGLPSVIHQFIIQHHGDSLASFFYHQALKEEGNEKITEEQFRYTCPKPNSKEAAILMLADIVESAVRSLKNPSPEDTEALITKLFQEKLMDGQLSESPLTQKDLKTIASTFNRVLRGMQHHRIKYHENVLEELENKTRIKLQSASDVALLKKLKEDLPSVPETGSKNKEDDNKKES